MGLISRLKGTFPWRKHYVSSMNTKDKIFHRMGSGCRYLAAIRRRNTLYFRTARDAERKGLHMCSVCRHRIQQKKIRDYM